MASAKVQSLLCWLKDKLLSIIPSNEINTHNNDENKDRGNWSNPIEFIISAIGVFFRFILFLNFYYHFLIHSQFAVGLGNVWRFPFVCYRNGGGAFLIIYWILSLTVGLPVLMLGTYFITEKKFDEKKYRNRNELGTIHVWRANALLAICSRWFYFH